MDEIRIVAAVAAIGFLIGGGALLRRAVKDSDGPVRQLQIAGAVLLVFSLLSSGAFVYATREVNAQAQWDLETQQLRTELAEKFPATTPAEIDFFLFLSRSEKPNLDESVTLEGFKELRVSDLLLWRRPIPNYGRLVDIRMTVREWQEHMASLGYQVQEGSADKLRIIMEIPNSSMKSLIDLVTESFQK